MESSFLNGDWKHWEGIADDTLRIEDHLPISRISRFGDDVWNFNDSTKPRILTKAPHQLIVNWHEYADKLPPALLRSARILGFFCVHHPSLISTQRKISKQGLAPTYCCQLIQVSLSFLAEVCAQASMPLVGATSSTSYIQTLADITVADIQGAFPHWRTKSMVDQLRKVLGAFTIPIIQRYLPAPAAGGAPVRWNYHDIETADLHKRTKSPSGEGVGFRDKPLPDDLFTFLASTATNDVLSLLIRLGRTPCTPVTESNESDIFSKYANFNEPYEGYMELASERYEEIHKKVASGCTTRVRNAGRALEFRNKFGVSVGTLRETVERVQTAAKYLLLQFTGVRYSEAALLRKGCLIKLPGGDYVIKGTVVKGQSVNLLTGLDHWVACPIVRDAVAVLEELTRLNRCEYFFATNRYSALKEVDKPITNCAFNNMLSIYLYDIDKQRKYSVDGALSNARHQGVRAPYRLTSHRLRHTLALHMSRAGLNIPYISMHLKHVYQAHKQFQGGLQDVTLGYGGIGSDIFQNAVGIKQANKEMTRAVYHPQAPIAGPGAQEFKQNRSYYFAGMLANGWELDEILENLAARSLPLADVGLGFCKGRREIEENGTKQPPPCIGQLKCNPARCKNAIIPPSKAPMWLLLYKVNIQRMKDPLMTHGHPEYAAIVEEAKQVLGTLGINVEEI